VKYAHHRDGEAHFSQTGRVYTHVRKRSVPLNEQIGHLWTIQLQGLNGFRSEFQAVNKYFRTVCCSSTEKTSAPTFARSGVCAPAMAVRSGSPYRAWRPARISAEKCLRKKRYD
jgi:hypothetical protein